MCVRGVGGGRTDMRDRGPPYLHAPPYMLSSLRVAGTAEAGLVVNLNGDGAAWSSPMFGAGAEEAVCPTRAI